MTDNIIPAADLPLAAPGATDTVVGVNEASGQNRRFRISHLPASDATLAARDAAQLSAGVYTNTAAGIAATMDGQYFSVPSAESDEYLILYKNVTGVATEVKRYPAVAAVDAVRAKVRGTSADGAYSEDFGDNTPITATNLTDAGTPSQTYTYGASGLTIALSTASRSIKYSTLNTVAGKKSRITLTQVMNSGATTPGVGFGIGAKAWWYTSDGRVTEFGTGLLTATAPTFAAPVTITTVIEIDDSGNMTATWSHAGGSVSITRTGVTMGAFSLVHRSTTNITHSATIETVGEYQKAVIDAAAADELTSDDALALKALTGLLAQLARVVPAGLTNPIPYDFKAYKLSGVREFFTNVDLRAPLSETASDVTVVYVDPISGSDSNPGTEASPYLSIKKGIQANGDKLIVKCKPGLYDKDTCWGSTSPAGSICQVVPWGDGEVISSCHHPSLSWSLVSGATYSATIVDVSSVADASSVDADGDYALLTLRTSQAAVEANPGSYYVTGTTIYVQTTDSRAPDSDIRVYRSFGSLSNGRATVAGQLLYMENIKFHGGSAAFGSRLSSSSTAATILSRNCDFKYAGGDNFDINGHYLCVSQGCIAAHGVSDGFNYHAIFGSDGPDMIEVDCIGRWNGRDTAGTNNGSTLHDPTSIGIRVNGDYHHNQDRNVHDVGGSMSWNLGVTARDSQDTTTSDGSNFAAGLSGDATLTKMWLDTCTSSGSLFDLDAPSGDGVIYTYDLVSDGNNVVGADVQLYQA